jgi:hypothetical protein
MATKPKRFCAKEYEPNPRRRVPGFDNPRQVCGLTFSTALRRAKAVARDGRIGYVVAGGEEYRSQRPLLTCKRFAIEGVVCTPQPGITMQAKSYREVYEVEGDPAAGHRRRVYGSW